MAVNGEFEVAAEDDSIELVVRYERMNTFFADYAKNISRGGTFVVTSEPLPNNTEFVFALAIPELENPLQLRAKVISRISANDSTDSKPAGMDIRFQYGTDDERQGLEATIEALMVAHLGERHVTALLNRPPVLTV